MCVRTKVDRRRPQGLLKTLPVPHLPFEITPTDEMSGFPEVDGNDCVMVIRDRATKYCVLCILSGLENAASRAHGGDFLRRNRNKVRLTKTDNFRSRVKIHIGLLAALTRLFGVQRGLSTAYHPQTDGQTERVNLDIQAYLRAFVNEKQDDWPTHLKMAQYVLNNAVHTIIGMSPNMALMGYNISFPNELVEATTKDVNDHHTFARQRAKSLLQVRDVATKFHKQALADMKRFADRYRRDQEAGDQKAPYIKPEISKPGPWGTVTCTQRTSPPQLRPAGWRWPDARKTRTNRTARLVVLEYSSPPAVDICMPSSDLITRTDQKRQHTEQSPLLVFPQHLVRGSTA